ncbi:hypothetical protein KFE25_008908 [Diacronema lutheri]|uniref:Endonuclease/exonuclease/phosphatase domain-containing protein n=1 Tax=Diacronema lutheri TaxID=2081491 RepID=A0A8J5XXE0_DIALT|nr:hypothetical protein KFE25_008908 [Diacronema lutheri]
MESLRELLRDKFEANKRSDGGELAAAGPSTAPFTFAVLSFNVWFEYEHTFADRMRAIFELVGGAAAVGTRPSALALQELTPPQQALLRPQLERLGFTSYVEQTDKKNGYWCALATRAPLGPVRDGRWRPFACGSMMSRGLVLGSAHFAAPDDGRGGLIVLASTHLESFVGEDMRATVCKMRKAQLAEAGRVLEAEVARLGACAGVLLGDMNWDDTTDGDATKLLGDRWLDGWEAAGRPAGAQYTYDGRVNGMLTHSFRSRLDRCFVWTPHAEPDDAPRCTVSLVGKSAIGRGLTLKKTMRRGGTRTLPLFASDHFGLLVSVEIGARARAESGAQPAVVLPPPPARERDAPEQRGAKRRPGPAHETSCTAGLSADEPIELE